MNTRPSVRKARFLATALTLAQGLAEAGVLAVTGYHGAGAIEAVLPVLEAAGVPLIGAARASSK